MARQSPSVGKTDSRYWGKRVFKLARSAHYGFRVQIDGKRVKLSAHCSSKAAAATKAARFFADMDSVGYQVALERLRPQVAERRRKRDAVAPIGEYLEAARSVMDVRPPTFSSYAWSLRTIATDILKEERTAKRFGRSKGNPFRVAVDGASLAIFTPEAVQSWRLAYVARAGDDGAASRRARISANSIIRQARSLFGRKVMKFLASRLRLPDPLPFAGVEFFPRESMRYVSRIDVCELMPRAERELVESDAPAFLVMLLALAAGLRRGEIDRQLWRNVDLDAGRIIVEDTEAGALKTDDSRGAVDIDERTVEILRGFRARASGPFLIESEVPEGATARAWGNRYRCQGVFDRVNGWLRAHGVEGSKPLHTLRKEAGAILATTEGIYAASHFLRHADISTTARHYADKKTRTVIRMGAILPADNVTEIRPRAGGAPPGDAMASARRHRR